MSAISIRTASAANVRAFQNLALVLRTGDNPWAKLIDLEGLEDEIGRFRVWIGNLGALQKGHSSLDYRLRDSPLLSSNVIKFLKELEDNLNEAYAVASGARLPYELQPKPEEGEADVDEDDDFFDADDDDDEDEDGKSRTELAMRQAEVVDIIDNLYKLSVRIRTPTIRSRSLKAATYTPKDPDTGIDLLSTYAEYDLKYIQELILHLRKPFIGNVDTEAAESDYLVPRLSAAVTLRRRQFKYWKRHRDKLGSTVQEETAIAPLPLTRPENLQRGDTLEAQPDIPVVETPKEAPSHKTGRTLLSGTEATRHHQSLDEIVDTKSVTSYAVTVKDMHGKGVDLPPPPRAANGEKDFECPYCYIICPARYGSGRAWRTHLLQDLQPYICTFPDCESAEQLFRSRREWVEHEASHRKAWRCPEHPAAVYKTSTGLADHLRRKHADSIPDSQLPVILKVGETTTVDLRSKCPICCIPVDTEGLGDFHNHIANHLERIATFALPKGVEEDSDGASSAASGGRSDSGSSYIRSELTFTNSSLGSTDEARAGIRGERSEGNVEADPVESNRLPLLSSEALSQLPDSSQTRLNTLFQSPTSDSVRTSDAPDSVSSDGDHSGPILDPLLIPARHEGILNPNDIPTLRVMYRSRLLVQRDQLFAPNDSYNRIVSFCYHDLTKLRVDGIVNSVNKDIRPTTSDSLNNAIHRAAGPSLAKETRARPKPSHAIVTGGYMLPGKYVIHTFRPRTMEHFDQLIDCYQSAFKAAAAHGMKTIAFPCVGTGGVGFPPRVAARYALEETRKFLDANPDHKFEQIIFCVNTALDEKAYLDFIPVIFPPTHGDLEGARSSVLSEDRSAIVKKIMDTRNQILNVSADLELSLALTVPGFPKAVLRKLGAIHTGLASIRRVILSSPEASQGFPDVKLICSVMQLFCGSITEMINLAKDRAGSGQQSDELIWSDFTSDFLSRHRLDIFKMLDSCREFVQSLETSASMTRQNVVSAHMGTLRQALERYRDGHGGEKSGAASQERLDEVLYTREYQRETITQSTPRDTIKLYQLPSVSQLYESGKLKEKQTMAQPNASFNNSVCFVCEDLTRLEVDVIVNSSDVSFSGIGTLNRSVLKKGTIDLQNAVKEFGQCAVGDVKVTNGYALPAKHIVHVIPPDRLGKASENILRKLYREALHAAVKLKAASVAIPSIGTGMLNWPRRDSAVLALQEIKRFLETADHSLEKIVVVVYSHSDELIYRTLLPVYFPPVDLGRSRGSPQDPDAFSSDRPKRTLFDSAEEAFRSVRFGKLPANSRSISASEELALIKFENHAKSCDTCEDIERLYLEGRDLCEEGYGLAQRVLMHMNMQEDQTVWSKPDIRGRSVSLDIPGDLYPRCITLLVTVERSYRDAGQSRPFVSINRSFSAISKDQAQIPSESGLARPYWKYQEEGGEVVKKARAHVLAHSQVSDQWEPVFEAECDIRTDASTSKISVRSPTTKQTMMVLELKSTTRVERRKTAPEILLTNATAVESPGTYLSPREVLLFRCPSDSECNSLLRTIRHALEEIERKRGESQEVPEESPLAKRIMECLSRDLVERPGSYIGQSTDRIITTLEAPKEEVLPKLAELKAKGEVYNTVDDHTWVMAKPPTELPVLSKGQHEDHPVAREKSPAPSSTAEQESSETQISPLSKKVFAYLVERTASGGRFAHEVGRMARDLDKTQYEVYQALTELEKIGKARVNEVDDHGDLWWVAIEPEAKPDTTSSDPHATSRQTNIAPQNASPQATIRDPPSISFIPPSPTTSHHPTITPFIDSMNVQDLYMHPSPANPKWTRVDKRLIDPRVLIEADEAFYDMGDNLEVHRVLRRGEIERWASASVAMRTRDRKQRDRRDEDQERLDRVIAGDMAEGELRRYKDEEER